MSGSLEGDGDEAGFPPGFFRRTDEAPDVQFYGPRRLVTHIDDRAIAAVGRLYAHLGIDGTASEPRRVLDLMSSWVSHFVTPPAELVALGMNQDELEANEAATERICHDLNLTPGAAVPRRVVRRGDVLRVDRLPDSARRGAPRRRRESFGPMDWSSSRSATVLPDQGHPRLAGDRRRGPRADRAGVPAPDRPLRRGRGCSVHPLRAPGVTLSMRSGPPARPGREHSSVSCDERPTCAAPLSAI